MTCKPPRLSIVIPCVGNVALTERCLDSLRETTHGTYEIVLVDNGSLPEHAAHLREMGAHVYLRHTHLLGFPKACNTGIRASHGDYICLLNNDTEMVTPGWDDRLIATLESTGAAIVSPLTNFIANPEQQGGPDDLRQPYPAAVLFFVCVVMRRRLFDTVGLLDEDFGLGNSEDAEYCYRVQQAGGRLYVEPSVFVQHVGHATFKRLPAGQFAELLDRNLAIMKRKTRRTKEVFVPQQVLRRN